MTRPSDKVTLPTAAELFARMKSEALDVLSPGYLGDRVNNWRVGGVAQSLLYLWAYGQTVLANVFRLAVDQCFIESSEGDWLDRHGAQIKVPRNPEGLAVYAVQLQRDVAGHPQPEVINIPVGAGLKLTGTDGATLTFRTKTAATIATDSDLSGVVEIEAEAVGAAYNIDVEQYAAAAPPFLPVSTLTGVDPATPVAPGLTVTNVGADTETDALYKARLLLYPAQRAEATIRDKFESVARGVAGVEDVYVDDRAPRGPGTADIIVKPAAARAAVQTAIDPYRGLCDDILARAASAHATAIVVYVETAAGYVPQAVAAEIRARVAALFTADAAYPEVKSLSIAGVLAISRIVEIVQQTPGVARLPVHATTESPVKIDGEGTDLQLGKREYATLGSITVVSV